MALECFGNLANVPNRIIRQRRGELLSMVGLADRGRDRVRKYSKGMVQRLGIAQALLNEPKLLILDEPTDGLDPRARAEVREVIRGLTEKGVTIFLNSHLLGEVESTCDRVAILDRGELKYCGGVNEIGDFIGAHQGEIEVQIRIKADLGAAHAAFQDTNFQITEKHSDSEFGVTARFANQEGIDALLDRLLKNKISLISLQRKQISLEDAFLRIVDDPANKATIRNYLK
jgi:ABC-2 type transport system ATP-binding protein